MKLFASDYDGTYWKHTFKGQVDLVKNIKQTKQWREEGNLFVFATGRPISMMRLEKYMHGIVYDYIVGLNGGIIISKTGDILFRETINNSIARKIMILIQQKRCYITRSVMDYVATIIRLLDGPTRLFIYLPFLNYF